MGRRPNKCYRFLNKKAYVKSKYCRSGPESKLSLHDHGNKKASVLLFPLRVNLISLEREHLSSECLEACRMAANKYLVRKLGKDNFHMRICPQPLNLLRINKMLTCAGADRLQTGMRNSFGKPYGMAARIFEDQHVIDVRTKAGNELVVKEALRRARNKLPGKQEIRVSETWGFTGLRTDKFNELKEKGLLLCSGVSVSVIKPKGPIATFLKKKERAL